MTFLGNYIYTDVNVDSGSSSFINSCSFCASTNNVEINIYHLFVSYTCLNWYYVSVTIWEGVTHQPVRQKDQCQLPFVIVIMKQWLGIGIRIISIIRGHHMDFSTWWQRLRFDSVRLLTGWLVDPWGGLIGGSWGLHFGIFVWHEVQATVDLHFANWLCDWWVAGWGTVYLRVKIFFPFLTEEKDAGGTSGGESFHHKSELNLIIF